MKIQNHNYLSDQEDLGKALYSISSLLGSAREDGHPVYLPIDEDDNFSNTIIMSPAGKKEDYKKFVREEGILRTLEESLPEMTQPRIQKAFFLRFGLRKFQGAMEMIWWQWN